MWKHVLVAVTVTVGLTGFAPAPMPDLGREQKSEQERARLQGVWTVEEYSQGAGAGSAYGQPSQVQISKDRLVLTGNHSPYLLSGEVVNVRLGGLRKASYAYAPVVPMNRVFRFVLEPGRKSGALDLVDEASQKVVYRGIYKLDGNVLTVSYRESAGASRPTSLADRAGRIVVLKLRRTGTPATR